MIATNLHGKSGLCKTIQDIYLASTQEDVRFKCRIAMRLAKMMDGKLRQYKAQFEPEK